jgi:hypothetical protein
LSYSKFGCHADHDYSEAKSLEGTSLEGLVGAKSLGGRGVGGSGGTSKGSLRGLIRAKSLELRGMSRGWIAKSFKGVGVGKG